MKIQHLAAVIAFGFVASAAVACGGGKPAESPASAGPTDTASKSATTASAPSTASSPAGPMDGPAAPTNSDDVKKGIAAMKAGNWNAARDAFEAALKKNPKQADAHFYLGVVMEKTGDKAAAEKHYKDALAADPNLDEAAVNLTAFYIDAQKWDDAIELAKKAVAKNNKNAAMQLSLALALAGKGDQAGAMKAFDEATRLEPNNAEYFLAYGHQLAEWKKQPEAVTKLKQALAVAHDDAGLLGQIGLELRSLRAVPECIQAMDKAIAAKDNAEFRVIRGQCKMANKDKAGALADAQAAVASQPDYPPAHYWLGSWLGEDGKYKEAVSEFETYLKLAPKGPFAESAQKKIKLAKDKSGGKK
jgi:tetratricopeptide (TPR) repeat protein